jgi:hypothetical protein
MAARIELVTNIECHAERGFAGIANPSRSTPIVRYALCTSVILSEERSDESKDPYRYDESRPNSG